MGVGKGVKGGQVPLHFENFNEWKKWNLATFGPPRKILEKSLSAPLWNKIRPTLMDPVQGLPHEAK